MACFLAVVFALFCSARVGWFILFVLILAPAISVLLTFLAAAFTSVSCSVSSNICQKGSKIILTIHMRPPLSYYPMPGIKTEYEYSPGLLFIPDAGVKGMSFVFQGEYSGLSVIGVKSIYFADYFGLVRFKARRFRETGFKIGVIPQVRVIPSDSELLRKAMSGVDMTGMSEDTVEETSGNFGGFPGYDHREYMPGDPVRRINYKLSARKDQYFVRLDEKQVYGNIEIFIDPRVPSEVAAKGGVFVSAWWDNTLQDDLGLCETLLSRQFSISLRYYIEDEEIVKELRQCGDGAALCEELAWCGYKL